MLKAELFVIGQVHKRASYTDTINNALSTVKQVIDFQIKRKSHSQMNFFRVEAARKAAVHWISFTKKKKKLRDILKGTKAEPYLMNQIERARANRSQGVASVLTNFLESIRAMMKARKLLERSLGSFRLRIPAISQL